MRAIMLAAGLGWRLGAGEHQPPKCLLNFDGQSLLERHLQALAGLGVKQVHIGVGYRHQDIRAELRRLDLRMDVELIYNPDFQQGNIVTLDCLREALRGGGEILLMDADVLYHEDIMRRLCSSAHANSFLMDLDFEAGEEPVKLCVRDGRLQEFSKQIDPAASYDLCGESVGFFKLCESMAMRLADKTAGYIERGDREAFYEAALRELLLEYPEQFGFEDITGIPWIEIDFQEDIARAEREVMAHIRAREAA